MKLNPKFTNLNCIKCFEGGERFLYIDELSNKGGFDTDIHPFTNEKLNEIIGVFPSATGKFEISGNIFFVKYYNIWEGPSDVLGQVLGISENEQFEKIEWYSWEGTENYILRWLMFMFESILDEDKFHKGVEHFEVLKEIGYLDIDTSDSPAKINITQVFGE